MEKKNFIKKAREMHGNSYIYDAVPNEFCVNDKVDILCPQHGYFRQRASAHYDGQRCPICAKEHLWDKRKGERMTTECFIRKAKKVHGNKYDYSLVQCNCSRDKIVIICPIHGRFSQFAANHLSGQGCPLCAQKRISDELSLGKEEIIKRCITTHGNRYVYDIVDAQKVTDKIQIICPQHGVFRQRAFHHIKGAICPRCAKEKLHDSRLANRLSLDEFIARANKEHDNFYSYEKVIYTSNKKKITITCPKHGDFVQVAYAHLHGQGCPKCAHERNAARCRNTQDDFINRARKVHGDYYSYDKTIYKTLVDYVTITCPIHGDFQQSPQAHLSGNGCAMCHRSKGEVAIAAFLKKHNINFEIQKKLYNPYFFGNREFFLLDFYLPEDNIIIEYNGEQHYKSVPYFGGERMFAEQRERDDCLRLYCRENHIKLIEIPYTEFRNIESILMKELKIKKYD